MNLSWRREFCRWMSKLWLSPTSAGHLPIYTRPWCVLCQAVSILVNNRAPKQNLWRTTNFVVTIACNHLNQYCHLTEVFGVTPKAASHWWCNANKSAGFLHTLGQWGSAVLQKPTADNTGISVIWFEDLIVIRPSITRTKVSGGYNRPHDFNRITKQSAGQQSTEVVVLNSTKSNTTYDYNCKQMGIV